MATSSSSPPQPPPPPPFHVSTFAVESPMLSTPTQPRSRAVHQQHQHHHDPNQPDHNSPHRPPSSHQQQQQAQQQAQQQQQQSPTQNFNRLPTLHTHQASLDLSSLDVNDSSPSVFHPQLQRLHTTPALPVADDGQAHAFNHHAQPQGSDAFKHLHTSPSPSHPQPPPSAHGSFGILATASFPPPAHLLAQLPPDSDIFNQGAHPSSSDQKTHGQLVSKIVVDPPDLQAWRQKLFDVDDTIVLTNEQ
jgi:glutathione S-transferase